MRPVVFVVAIIALVAGATCCSSSTNSSSTPDAGESSDAGGITGDSGGAVGSDAGNDSGNPGSGGCLGGGDVGNCVVSSATSGAGACITGDFCTSADGLNGAVEASVIACETQDTTAPTCSRIPSCVFAALAQACPDSTTATQCGDVVGACADAGVSDGGAGAVTLASCEQILAGFNVTTRTVFANCWSMSCNLDQCVSNLFSPP
jgi:hypothetical protein